jgi:ring-1,2-phenylacetyl-CoA epoxidase subunit PaaD
VTLRTGSDPACDDAALQAVSDTVCDVPDPELPYVTIGDLGIVRSIAIAGDTATVVLTPTYTGCPATEQIAADVADAVRGAGYAPDVRTTLAPAWSTDWITARGRQRLADAGIAPPGAIVSCPRCGSQLARLVSEFSGTACKALYTCQSCREPFELFKAI